LFPVITTNNLLTGRGNYIPSKGHFGQAKHGYIKWFGFRLDER